MPTPPAGSEAEELEAALDMAEVCIAAGLQPSEYKALTDDERNAFVEVLNRK